jgi:hypothetical protein
MPDHARLDGRDASRRRLVTRLLCQRRNPDLRSLVSQECEHHPVSDIHRAESRQLCAGLHVFMDRISMETRVSGLSVYAVVLANSEF